MRIKTAIAGALWTILTLSSNTSNATNFSCTGNLSSTEQAICSNTELSALDEQLSAVYRRAATTLANDTELLSQLRGDQRSWLDSRQRCVVDTSCIRLAYQGRIAYLERYISQGPAQITEPDNGNIPEPEAHANTTICAGTIHVGNLASDLGDCTFVNSSAAAGVIFAKCRNSTEKCQVEAEVRNGLIETVHAVSVVQPDEPVADEPAESVAREEEAGRNAAREWEASEEAKGTVDATTADHSQTDAEAEAESERIQANINRWEREAESAQSTSSEPTEKGWFSRLTDTLGITSSGLPDMTADTTVAESQTNDVPVQFEAPSENDTSMDKYLGIGYVAIFVISLLGVLFSALIHWFGFFVARLKAVRPRFLKLLAIQVIAFAVFDLLLAWAVTSLPSAASTMTMVAAAGQSSAVTFAAMAIAMLPLVYLLAVVVATKAIARPITWKQALLSVIPLAVLGAFYTLPAIIALLS